MNPISKKIHLYNVTMGLYMLDWWERYLFNILIMVLLWFMCYNGYKTTVQFYDNHLKSMPLFGGNYAFGGNVPS